MLRWLLPCLLIVASLSCSMPRAIWAADSREMFVAKFRCAVTDRLITVRENGDPSVSTNRFVIVALADFPDRFAQCIYHDDDSKLYCEAASGYFARKGSRRPLEFGPEALVALESHGFSTDQSEGNFVRRFDEVPEQLEQIAELLLSVLHDVYGARVDTRLEIVAPLARSPSGRCRPIS